jgi:shikimate dehydrogenase
MIRLGLVGCPLDHSLSPALHNAALRACGLQGGYSLFPVKQVDIQGLKSILNRVRSGELTGVNITAPHKQNTIRFLDELTLPARSIGAVNTIYLKEGKLIGDNTDAPGFLTDLNSFLQEDQAPGWIREKRMKKSVLILGAGGSARAVGYALANTGWTITIAARNFDKAKELANSHFHIAQYDTMHIESQLSTFHLIVNATPIGMFPKIDASPWFAGLAFPKAAVLYDLVYNPRETLLVKQARAAGLRASTGIGMLVEQAALAFQLWTGEVIPRRIMFDAINKPNP